jgi:hypothetical protein
MTPVRLRRAALASLLTIAVLGVAACGSDPEPAAESSGDSTSTSTESESAMPSESPSDGATDNGSGGAASEPIAVGKTVTDPDLGDKVVVKNVVRNFPIPASAQAMADNGNELVLVEMEVSVGEKYYSNIDSSSFTWGVGTEEYSGQSASQPDVQSAMKAAGYTPLETVRTGESGSGWVAGFLKKPNDPAGYVAYRRVELRGSDGKSFPEKSWPVTLPTA